MFVNSKKNTNTLTAALLCCAAATVCTNNAQAFTTIYNIPPDTAPTSIGSDTQLNLYDSGVLDSSFIVGGILGSTTNVELNVFGGEVGNSLRVNSGSTVNISGGEIGSSVVATKGSIFNITGGVLGSSFNAYRGSTINIAGGEIDHSFNAYENSVVNITGGVVGFSFDAYSGSVVNIHGGRVGSLFTAKSGSNILIDGGYIDDNSSFEAGSSVAIYGSNFKIDNVPVAGLDVLGNAVAVNVPEGSFVTGILPDGSVAAFDGNFADGTLTLHAASVPSSPQTVFNIPSDPAPAGLREGQVLNLADGGVIDTDLIATSATLNIDGGSIGYQSKIYNSDVNFNAGQVNARIYKDTNVNMTGGLLLSQFYDGASLDLHGGIVDDDFIVRDGASISIHGSDFRLNGTPVAGLETIGETLPVNIGDGAVLTGVLEDGSVFLFSNLNDDIADGTITLVESNIPAPAQMVYNLPGDTPPVGLRVGQTLILGPDSEPATTNFAAYNATILINGGNLGYEPEVVNSVVTMTSGEIGLGFDAHYGSVVNIQGGYVGPSFDAGDGSTINITGGNISFNFDANPGSTVNYMGGHIDRSFGASADSVVNIYGTSFFLDGVDITASFTPGVPFTITDRDVTFTCTVLSGHTFTFNLRSTDYTIGSGSGYCDPDATLTIMVPIPGDLNADGFVGLDDLDRLLANWNTTVTPGDLLNGDANNDGYIGLDDLDLILNHWNTGTPPQSITIPEPASIGLLMLSATAITQRRHRVSRK